MSIDSIWVRYITIVAPRKKPKLSVAYACKIYTLKSAVATLSTVIVSFLKVFSYILKFWLFKSTKSQRFHLFLHNSKNSVFTGIRYKAVIVVVIDLFIVHNTIQQSVMDWLTSSHYFGRYRFRHFSLETQYAAIWAEKKWPNSMTFM